MRTGKLLGLSSIENASLENRPFKCTGHHLRDTEPAISGLKQFSIEVFLSLPV
jgi:hypothetical protein